VRLTLTITIVLLTVLASAVAWSRSFSRSANIHRPFAQVYASMSNYFSPNSLRDFQIVSMNKNRSKAELVAKRTVQDQLKWTNWAYCKVPTLRLFDSLQQGDITVRMKLDREGADRTFVTVRAEFQGIYQFAGNSRVQQCSSNGALEKDILRAAGASDGNFD